MFLIVGWNELEGYHILQDLEGAFITHYIGTYPYLLRTLLDIVAEVRIKGYLKSSYRNTKRLIFMISIKQQRKTMRRKSIRI